MINTPERVLVLLNKESRDLGYCTPNFCWTELLIKQTEIPSLGVLKNLKTIATTLEGYRNKYFKNKPITITSGWRSVSYNGKLGGAPHSYHCKGLALDFVVAEFTPKQVQKVLDPIHGGGMEYAPTWTHIDARGHKARFNP